jgi:hypothetical protein
MEEDEDYCDHSFVLKDDIGYVCRICGVIEKAIDTIIEIQFNKVNLLQFLLLWPFVVLANCTGMESF